MLTGLRKGKAGVHSGSNYIFVSHQKSRIMSKMRKIALGGIGVVVLASIALKIAGIHPGIVAVHALPFCMLLLIDLTHKRSRESSDQDQQ
jgi:FtsH-binding integral membrane protein